MLRVRHTAGRSGAGGRCGGRACWWPMAAERSRGPARLPGCCHGFRVRCCRRRARHERGPSRVCSARRVGAAGMQRAFWSANAVKTSCPVVCVVSMCIVHCWHVLWACAARVACAGTRARCVDYRIPCLQLCIEREAPCVQYGGTRVRPSTKTRPHPPRQVFPGDRGPSAERGARAGGAGGAIGARARGGGVRGNCECSV